MRKSICGILLCLAAYVALLNTMPVSAQNPIEIESITSVNLGDGRILFRELESEKTLNGSHRLIHGIRSEYIDAEFTDGLYNGTYEYHKNNVLVEKGTYKEGVKNGIFTEYYSDGTPKSETPITDGKVDGVVKEYHPDGTLESEKGYKAGKEHGPERYWEFGANKPRIERNYFEGVPDGRQYREISSNVGDYVEVAHFDKGVPTGEFLQTWAESGDIKERGSYKDGKKHGVWEQIRRDGKKESEITYAGGKRNGESKSFFTDNSVEKITMYVDDRREGVEKTFRYESELIASEYTYKAGIRDGAYKTYYDDEKPTLREEGRYERDTQVYYKEYYDSGQLRRVRQRNKGSWETLEEYSWDGTRREQ